MTNCRDWKTGCSVCARSHLTEKDFAEYEEAGVTAMELSYAYQLYEDINWSELPVWAARHGVEFWSFHLPFQHQLVNPAHPDDGVRAHTITLDRELLKKAAAIGVKVAVIHASGEPISDTDRNESMLRAKSSLALLADAAAGDGLTLAAEDLPRSCLGRNSTEILDLLSSDPRLRACFDTNHLLGESIADFIEAVAGKIITLHVSDYDFINERHWLPGEGKIDWPELIGLLEKYDYRGPFMYELGLEPEMTIKRRRLTRADFRENHMTLSRHVFPEPAGVPDQEGMREQCRLCGINLD